VGNRVKRRRAPGASSQLLRAAIWTALLCVGLIALDRGLMGPKRVQPGWNEATSLDKLPAKAGLALTPTFLPNSVQWPPALILYRLSDEPGWWFGIKEADTDDWVLWLGTSVRFPPPAMGPVEGCLEDNFAPCPPGWRSLSGHVGDQVVHVTTRLPPGQGARILKSMQ